MPGKRSRPLPVEKSKTHAPAAFEAHFAPYGFHTGFGQLRILCNFYIAMERNSIERPFALSHPTAFLPVLAQEEAAV
jgi:hypothetical protein